MLLDADARQVAGKTEEGKIIRIRASKRLHVLARTVQRKMKEYRGLTEECFEHGDKG